jgi:hypothetical protein
MANRTDKYLKKYYYCFYASMDPVDLCIITQ